MIRSSEPNDCKTVDKVECNGSLQKKRINSQLNGSTVVNRNKKMKISESDEWSHVVSIDYIPNGEHKISSYNSIRQRKRGSEDDINSLNKFNGFLQASGDIRDEGECKNVILYDNNSTLNRCNNTMQSTNLLQGDDIMEETKNWEEEEDTTLPTSNDDCKNDIFTTTAYDRGMHVSEYEASLLADEYLCTVCDKEFSNYVLYKKHLLSFHKQGREYKCTECKSLFDKLTTYRKHIKIHPDYPDEERGNEGNLDAQLYVCKSCKLLLNGKNEFFAHCYDKHPKKRIKITKLQDDSDDDEYVIEGRSFKNRENNYESDSSATSCDINIKINSIIEKRRKEKRMNNSKKENGESIEEDKGCEGNVKNEKMIELSEMKNEMTLDELCSVLDAREDVLDNIMNKQKVNDISMLYENIRNSNKDKTEMKNNKEIENSEEIENKKEETEDITNRNITEEDYINVDIPFELEISAALQMNKELNLIDNIIKKEDDKITIDDKIENIIIQEHKTIKKPSLTIIKTEPYRQVENVTSLIESTLIPKNNESKKITQNNKIKSEMTDYDIITRELIKAKIKYSNNNRIKRTIEKNRKEEETIVKKELLNILKNNKDVITNNQNHVNCHASDLLILDEDLKYLKMNERDSTKEITNTGIKNNNNFQNKEMKMIGKSLEISKKGINTEIIENENILKIPSTNSFSEHEEFKRTINSNYFSKIDTLSWKNVKNMKNNLISGIYRKSRNTAEQTARELIQKNNIELIKNKFINGKFGISSGIYKISDNIKDSSSSKKIKSKISNNVEIWYKRRKIPIKQEIASNKNKLEFESLRNIENDIIKNKESEFTKNIINQNYTSLKRLNENKLENSKFIKIDNNVLLNNKTNENLNLSNFLKYEMNNKTCEEVGRRLKRKRENNFEEEETSLKNLNETIINLKSIKSEVNLPLSVVEEYERFNDSIKDEVNVSLNVAEEFERFNDSIKDEVDVSVNVAEEFERFNDSIKDEFNVLVNVAEEFERFNDSTIDEVDVSVNVAEVFERFNDSTKDEVNVSLSVAEEFEKFNDLENDLNNQELNFEGNRFSIKIENYGQNKRQKIKKEGNETEEVKRINEVVKKIKEEDEVMKFEGELKTPKVENNTVIKDELTPFLELDYMLSHGIKTNENDECDILLDITHKIIDQL